MSGPANYAKSAIPTILPDADGVTVTLPIKTVAGLNAREHWRARATRVSKERSAAKTFTPAIELPCVVTMTRLSYGELDSDNLQGAFKAIRDGIADKLGTDDRDPRIEWRYAQERCNRGEYFIRIRVERAEQARAAA